MIPFRVSDWGLVQKSHPQESHGLSNPVVGDTQSSALVYRPVVAIGRGRRPAGAPGVHVRVIDVPGVDAGPGPIAVGCESASRGPAWVALGGAASCLGRRRELHRAAARGGPPAA